MNGWMKEEEINFALLQRMVFHLFPLRIRTGIRWIHIWNGRARRIWCLLSLGKGGKGGHGKD